MSDTRWNGQPCEARRITAVVADDGTFPMYWARHLVGTRRKVVEVTYAGETFYLDDEADEGWHKVTHGGSPRWAHSNIIIDPATIQARAEDAAPPPTDRAAILREAISRVSSEVRAAQHSTPGDPRLPGLVAAVDGLSRMADEAQQPDTEARPRCPHCQLPHDLDPDGGAVAACASIRASLAEAERLHIEGDHTWCCRVDCEVVRERAAGAQQDGAQP